MKEFMMVFMADNYADLGFSPEEMQERMGKWMTWNNKMQEAGILKGGHALQAPAKRITGTDRVVTDGPFVEGKELIGGYYIIDAVDFDAAAEVAQDYPDLDIGGTVEIREVMVFDR